MTTTFRGAGDRRRLLWPACVNVRDLGGHRTKSGRRVRSGALVRADTLAHLTAEGREALRAFGVRAVLDLRSPHELACHPPPFGSPAVVEAGRDGQPEGDGLEIAAASSIAPVTASADSTLPPDGPEYRNIRLIDEVLDARLRETRTTEEAYATIFDEGKDRIGEAIRWIANAPDGAVVVHCQGGKDRTGLIVALVLWLVGVAAPEIAADYALSELYLGFMPDRLSSETDDLDEEAVERILADQADLMLATLAGVEGRYGGVEQYLLGAGVTAADLLRLRRRLLEEPRERA